MSATADTLPAKPAERPKPVEPWRRRFVRKMLYGSNVDRGAKARARIVLAIMAFTVVYAVIGARLVMFGVASNSHSVHRVVSDDAIATARPDILDRNGEVLATDVRVPSLYAEPRRLIDVDEAIELLTADLPDVNANELRERLSSKRGFVWLKRDVIAGTATRNLPPGPARHRLPSREQARLSQRFRSLASARPCRHRQSGHRRHREMARRPRA